MSAIAEIVVSQRSNGATVLRISLADPLGTRRIRHRRDPLDPRRYEFIVQGLELAAAPTSIEVERPNLERLELTQSQESGVP